MDENSELTEAGPDPRRDTQTSVDCATLDCVAQSHGQFTLRDRRQKMNTTQVHRTRARSESCRGSVTADASVTKGAGRVEAG